MINHQTDRIRLSHIRFTALEYSLAVICILSIGFVVINRYAHLGYSARPYLILASTAFVLPPLCCGGLRYWFGRLTWVALIFCWLGDFTGPWHFLVGAGFFLVGHMFLIAAFLVNGILRQRLWIALPLTLIISGSIAYWIVPSVSMDERWFVISYISMITGMVILACSAKGAAIHTMLSAGAVLFYISDVLLAMGRYLKVDVNYTYFGYPLYYGACLFFAFSVAVYRWETTANQMRTNLARNNRDGLNQ